MNWISRFTARIGSALAFVALATFGTLVAQAASSTIFVFQSQPLVFSHLTQSQGVAMVGVNDPGFRALLRAVGAVLTWKSGDRYVLVTTADPVVIGFAVGDTHYDVGPVGAQARVAPYASGDEVFLPFDEVLRALGLAEKRDGSTRVLQPQLTTLDVQGSADGVTLVARGAIALRPRVVADSSERVAYEFDGVGSTLEAARVVNAGGIRDLRIAVSGTVRAPKTLVTLTLLPNAHHDAARSSNDRDFQVAFGTSQTVAAVTATPATPTPWPAPAATPLETPQATQATPSPMVEPEASSLPSPSDVVPTAAPVAFVTSVTATPTGDGVTVTIAMSGSATFEWHRLREPDNRFWIDLKGAQLHMMPLDETEPDPLLSLRVRQNDAQTVRIALSLDGAKSLTVSPSTTGVTIAVARDDLAETPREGSGSVGAVVSVTEPQTLVSPAPLGEGSGAPEEWKFAPRNAYVPTNPKLIVIDPGHGGSDRGALHGSSAEADLALDMSKRLRDILIARGWQVQMTRATDIDVYQPNDTAHEELQARDDIANNAGARMLVSVHVNSFTNSGPHGTTVYYSKPSDVELARVVNRALAPNLGTKDDGIIKSHFYITLHAAMPAVLIETAFLSNPDDYARLVSPEWRQKVAEAIADGIDRYAHANPVSTGAGQ